MRSDGHFVSALDWRANRLVDSLARLAAKRLAVPDLASRMFEQAMHAAEYYAAFLGTVTHAANNHRVPEIKPNGTQVFKHYRDSAPGKRPPKSPVATDMDACMSAGLRTAESIVQGTKRGIREVPTPNDPPPMRPHPYLSGQPPIFVRFPAAITNSKLKLASKNQHVQNCGVFSAGIYVCVACVCAHVVIKCNKAKHAPRAWDVMLKPKVAWLYTLMQRGIRREVCRGKRKL